MKKMVSLEHFTQGVDDDINWGLKGLKVSLYCLLIILVILLIYLLIRVGFTDVPNMIFREPDTNDLLAIFAGIIIFIAVPFLLGIRLRAGLKSA